MSKQINTRIQYKYDSAENWANCDKSSLAGELYVHGPLSAEDEDQSIKLSIGDGMRKINELPLVGGTIESKELPLPYLINSQFEYTPEGHEVNIINYDERYMYIVEDTYEEGSSTIFRVNVGNYFVRIVAKDEYYWVDDYNNQVTYVDLPWCIVKSKDTIEADYVASELYPNLSTSYYLRGAELNDADLKLSYVTNLQSNDVIHLGEYFYSDNDLALIIPFWDSVNISDSYGVEKFLESISSTDFEVNISLTISRHNYEDEIVELMLTLKGYPKYIWNVYEAVDTSTSTPTAYEKFVRREVGWLQEQSEVPYWIAYYEQDVGTKVYSEPTDVPREGPYYETVYGDYCWQDIGVEDTVIAHSGSYTSGEVYDIDEYTYDYPVGYKYISYGYVQFDKGTYIRETDPYEDYTMYPDNDVQYSVTDNKWYYYELQD